MESGPRRGWGGACTASVLTEGVETPLTAAGQRRTRSRTNPHPPELSSLPPGSDSQKRPQYIGTAGAGMGMAPPRSPVPSSLLSASQRRILAWVCTEPRRKESGLGTTSSPEAIRRSSSLLRRFLCPLSQGGGAIVIMAESVKLAPASCQARDRWPSPSFSFPPRSALVHDRDAARIPPVALHQDLCGFRLLFRLLLLASPLAEGTERQPAPLRLTNGGSKRQLATAHGSSRSLLECLPS